MVEVAATRILLGGEVDSGEIVDGTTGGRSHRELRTIGETGRVRWSAEETSIGRVFIKLMSRCRGITCALQEAQPRLQQSYYSCAFLRNSSFNYKYVF